MNPFLKALIGFTPEPHCAGCDLGHHLDGVEVLMRRRKARGMTEKRVVTCPRCGFRISGEGDAASPALTGDAQALSRTCPLTGNFPGAMAEQPFNCPELLKAVRHAALIQGIGRTR